ncbi:MAG: type II toxin-antitoxin system VapC family toxin [Lysobacterales bacterium]
MRPRFLLDTNILSELVRRPQGQVAKCIEREGERSICTSIVVAAELRFGAQELGSERLSRQLETILGAIEILPLEEPADLHYASIRCALERRGELIGPNDLLIAAHALALENTLVTANEREFSRVPGLLVANWLGE